MLALEQRTWNFRFSTLAGVESASIEGESITGVWKSELAWKAQPKKAGWAAEDFVNWPDSEKAILQFTKRYGPLDDRPLPGKRFQFSIGQWREEQEGIRLLWQIVCSGGDHISWGKFKDDVWQSHFALEGADSWSIPTQEGDGFAYQRGQLVYRTATMLGFLKLDLLSVPHDYLRRCKRQDCPTRFFVAEHLREDYCSPICKQWAQRLWKRNWWNKKGKTQRKRRN